MDKRDEAIELANRMLDRPYADPDEDRAILARQLLRTIEAIDRAHQAGWNEAIEAAAVAVEPSTPCDNECECTTLRERAADIRAMRKGEK